MASSSAASGQDPIHQFAEKFNFNTTENFPSELTIDGKNFYIVTQENRFGIKVTIKKFGSTEIKPVFLGDVKLSEHPVEEGILSQFCFGRAWSKRSVSCISLESDSNRVCN